MRDRKVKEVRDVFVSSCRPSIVSEPFCKCGRSMYDQVSDCEEEKHKYSIWDKYKLSGVNVAIPVWAGKSGSLKKTVSLLEQDSNCLDYLVVKDHSLEVLSVGRQTLLYVHNHG